MNEGLGELRCRRHFLVLLRKEPSHLQGLPVLQAVQEAGGAGERVRIYQSER